ncbi:MAG: DUF3500 domain-containing protein [Pseudomonadota bacterium]|nr:DUF3500 domain-containing protein [Pseudomonadota bacterium]
MPTLTLPERQMALLARRFLDTLDGRIDQVLLPFAHHNRFDWHYIPRRRAGLHLRDMTDAQRQALDALLRFALSETGHRKAGDIRRLEAVLAAREQEEDYHPDNYACTVFGDPQQPPWGWRLEGHHLSLNFTVAGDGRVAATPAFTGANPAHVHDGPLQGLRVLGAEQDLAFALLHGLSDGQRQRAVIAARSPGDIVTGPLRRQTLERPLGVPLRELDGTLKSQAERLIDAYLDNLRAEFAAAHRRRLAQAGLEAVHFAWAGSHEPGRPHYYRLHGPRLLIEYDNTQDNANHIHAVCRDPNNDFGLDWLAQHYRGGHAHG